MHIYLSPHRKFVSFDQWYQIDKRHQKSILEHTFKIVYTKKHHFQLALF